jgi:hypothetical protein
MDIMYGRNATYGLWIWFIEIIQLGSVKLKE